MKVFDAHCHIYPAKIARKAAQTTAAFYDYTGETLDGTVQTPVSYTHLTLPTKLEV